MKAIAIMLRLLIPAAFIFLIDFYVFQGIQFLTSSLEAPIQGLITILWWALPILLLIYLVAYVFTGLSFLPKSWRSSIGAVFLLIYLGKFLMLGFFMLDDLRALFVRLIQGEEIGRSLWWSRIALAMGIFPSIILSYGMIRNPYRYRLHALDLEIEGLPDSLEGLSIVQISDIHSGSFANMEAVQKGIDLINEQVADFVFFTGDLVNSKADEMIPYIDMFKQIKGKYGVFSIMGNHDYGDYHRWESKEAYIENGRQFREVHKELGWNLLLNRHEEIKIGNASVGIIGVENYSAGKRFHKYGDLKKATEGMGETGINILLSHDPSHWDDEVNTNYKNIDLTLSGHTHGFQFGIEIPGFIKWSPSRFVYKQWAGLYEKGKQFLYVNRGFGFLGYPGRVGILPEVTKLVLRKKN